MTLEFNQIHRSAHLPGRIAAEIAREINDAKLQAGDRLPTEHILAKTFGVSRSVIREAIAHLRNEGYVETRQGVGAFVTDPRQRLSVKIERSTLNDPDNFRDLMQLRMSLEIDAAGLAALHHQPEHLTRLDLAIEGMRNATDWKTDGVEADLEFHRVLAEATANEYFGVFLGYIAERISSAINTAFERAVYGEIHEITVNEHVILRQAIASGDALAARSAMRTHILGAANRLNLELDVF
jgi:GntR family transcriptional repressor for pyruvate dehydrogenase complex